MPFPASQHTDPQSSSNDWSGRYALELDFLFSRLNYERSPDRAKSVADFRIDRMRELLERLGNPQLLIPCIHITGSKGKGSVASMIARVLEDTGLKAGLFTSPHISSYGERMTVNGQLPALHDLVPLMEDLRSVATVMDAGSVHGRPTFFELTTALGWLYFQQQEVDFVSLEVGLGGRLDSTNLCAPLVSVITSISFDHTRLLGNTLAEIAREKAGIIKRCVPVISGVLAPEARAVIESVAELKRSPLRSINTDFHFTGLSHKSTESPLPRPVFSVDGSCGKWQDIELGMAGEHQARNASLVLGIVTELHKVGLRISDEAVRSGLKRTTVPCRLEVLEQEPLVIADAAHNEASIRAMCETLRQVPAARRIVVFAASRDKDATAMLKALDGFADEVILTRYLNNPRAISPEELRSIAEQALTTQLAVAASPAEAMQQAKSKANSQSHIICTGSLFLAAEIRELCAN